MTQTDAKIVADSVSPPGVRLTTLELRFPTRILPQLNRYGSLAQSVRSFRAVRTETLIAEVEADPFVPAEWRYARKGMVAAGPMDADNARLADARWRRAASAAVEAARQLADQGGAKEHVNGLLAPFAYSVAAVTGTDDAWGWFLHQRLGERSQPEMQRLAEAVRDALAGSTPAPLDVGGWHLPYVQREHRRSFWAQVSAARCARVSYGTPKSWDTAGEVRFANERFTAGEWTPAEHPCLACSHKRPIGRHAGWLSLRARLGH